MTKIVKLKATRAVTLRDEACRVALNLMSEQLEALEGMTPHLMGESLVDVAARINAQSLALDKILSRLKDHLKEQGATDGVPVIRGLAYQARIREIVKTVLDIQSVKVFLGKKLSRFQVQRTETHVSFEVRE